MHRRRAASVPGPGGVRSLRLFDVQAVGSMKRTQRQLGIFFGNQDADLDLGGRDYLEVDSLLGQSGEHPLRDTGVRAHADTDDRDLDIV